MFDISQRIFKINPITHRHTVVGFKLSGPFKLFFDIFNVRVTFLDAKDPIK